MAGRGRTARLFAPPEHALVPGEVALLIVDMQYLDAHVSYGLCQRAAESGMDLTYYAGRLASATASIGRLVRGFRLRGLEVLYTRIMSLTHDGRDRSLAHKQAGIHAPPGSRESMILDEIAPVEGEMVFSKTVSSVFAGTNIDYVLRNLGVRTLVVTGVVTSGCVEAAVRDAFDRGYNVVLVEDGCADMVEAFHLAALDVLAPAAMVTSADEVLRRLPDV